MNFEVLKKPRPGRWEALCAGGYFAAASAYLANALVMAAVHSASPVVPVMLATIAIACALIGILILAEFAWTRKGGVVAAGGFATMHLIGLVFLLFDTPAATPALARSLQWQLGTALFFVWVSVLAAALQLDRSHEAHR